MTTASDDHPITIKPAPGRWRARYRGHVIADSGDALVLEETGHRPVVYFPREDVAMEYMSRTERSTHCPYKGDAAYYTLFVDGDFAENAIWTYEDPRPEVELIAGRLAFYPEQVEIYAVDEAKVNPHARHDAVDEVVQHTDAGDGTSQRSRWDARPEDMPPLV